MQGRTGMDTRTNTEQEAGPLVPLTTADHRRRSREKQAYIMAEKRHVFAGVKKQGPDRQSFRRFWHQSIYSMAARQWAPGMPPRQERRRTAKAMWHVLI